mgnify:CR=1 FL=1
MDALLLSPSSYPTPTSPGNGSGSGSAMEIDEPVAAASTGGRSPGTPPRPPSGSHGVAQQNGATGVPVPRDERPSRGDPRDAAPSSSFVRPSGPDSYSRPTSPASHASPRAPSAPSLPSLAPSGSPRPSFHRVRSPLRVPKPEPHSHTDSDMDDDPLDIKPVLDRPTGSASTSAAASPRESIDRKPSHAGSGSPSSSGGSTPVADVKPKGVGRGRKKVKKEEPEPQLVGDLPVATDQVRARFRPGLGRVGLELMGGRTGPEDVHGTGRVHLRVQGARQHQGVRGRGHGPRRL